MTKMETHKLSIPPQAADLCPLTSPEQIAIAAAHATDRVPDQTNDLRAVRRRQPLAARLTKDERIEQHGGNLSVACMLLPAVQCAEHADQASPLLSGERRQGWRRRSGQALPEMQCGCDTLRQMGVKGNNSRKRRGRRGISKHPKLAVAARLAQQDMAAVRPVDGECCWR